MSECVCGEINARNCPVHQSPIGSDFYDHMRAEGMTPENDPKQVAEGAREWWIDPEKVKELPPWPDQGEYTHVIEFSAFQRVVEERDALKRDRDQASADYGQAVKERDDARTRWADESFSLKSQLDRAKASLKKIKGGFMIPIRDGADRPIPMNYCKLIEEFGRIYEAEAAECLASLEGGKT